MLTDVRVLIVEDEPLVALDLEATFKGAGATVECARSIDHAIDIIQRGELNFCVLDTELWGRELSYRISDLLRWKRIPFAVFSSSRAEHDGAIAHVMKPFSSDDVVRVAERLLQLRQ